MSARVMNWARRQKVGDPTQKLVLFAPAHLANADGEFERGNAALAAVCEVGVETIRARLAALEKCGLMERRARFRLDGGQAENLIRIRVPATRQRPSAGAAALGDFNGATSQWGRA